MVILATAATVIASQAMISGAYSMARQCVQLGFLPRLTVRHTSTIEEGQIYLPQVNAMMAVGVTILVLAFKTSDNLAAAYGIAVTGTFLCTSVLATVVFRREFHWSRLTAVAVFGFFFVVDFLFFTSNLLKVPEGGWVPLVLGVVLTALMTSWKRGRDLLLARWRQDSLPLAPFLARLPQSRTIRVPGMAVFLTGNPDYVPTSLLHNLKHNKVLHERVLFVTVQNVDEPEVGADRRMRGVRAGAGHPSGDPALRLHGEPQHPARAGGSQQRPACRSIRCRRAISSAARCWSRPRCRSCPGGGTGCSWCWRATRCRPRNSSVSRTIGWWNSGCGWRSDRPFHLLSQM